MIRKTETKKRVELFLDSGAFSAWAKGAKIDLQDYIAFIKRHARAIDRYANLDVIGASQDGETNQQASERAAKATWDNQMTMEKAGLTPMPCYHYGEDIKWLNKYLDRGHKYIALGGMVPISTAQLIHWLDDLFGGSLANADGTPRVKVHGFGLTSLRLMLRYPWFSVDSTSWVLTSRMGSIYVPREIQGKWSYDVDSWKVAVSSQSPNKKEAGKHISTYSPLEQKTILRYLESKGYKLGQSEFRYELENYELAEGERWSGKADGYGERMVEKVLEVGICNSYRQRDELNIIFFRDLEQSMPKWPWSFQKQQRTSGFGLKGSLKK
jgi:hypothetical protein